MVAMPGNLREEASRPSSQISDENRQNYNTGDRREGRRAMGRRRRARGAARGLYKAFSGGFRSFSVGTPGNPASQNVRKPLAYIIIPGNPASQDARKLLRMSERPEIPLVRMPRDSPPKARAGHVPEDRKSFRSQKVETFRHGGNLSVSATGRFTRSHVTKRKVPRKFPSGFQKFLESHVI